MSGCEWLWAAVWGRERAGPVVGVGVVIVVVVVVVVAVFVVVVVVVVVITSSRPLTPADAPNNHHDLLGWLSWW